MQLEKDKIKQIIEAAIMVSEEPLSIKQISKILGNENVLENKELKAIINELHYEYQNRGITLKEVATGYRFQTRIDLAHWISRLWEERPPRYSRALLETLALITYKQPVTRAEIEAIRGVSVSTNIVRTLMEREWIKIAGYKEVPGRPALYITTSKFLDYFNIKSLDELPVLDELPNIEKVAVQLELALEENKEIEKASLEEAENDPDTQLSVERAQDETTSASE